MKIMKFIILFSFSFNLVASESFKGVEIPYEKVESLFTNEIDPNTTCLDEYLTRESQLRRFLIWAPPSTVVAAPAGFMIGGYSAAFLSGAAGVTGWAGLGYAVLGAGIGGLGVLGTFVGLETAKAIEFHNNRFMINLITAVRVESYQEKSVVSFLSKFRNKFPRSPLSDEEIFQSILELDSDARLCDGVVRGSSSSKLKKKLARKRHLLKYINSNF